MIYPVSNITFKQHYNSNSKQNPSFNGILDTCTRKVCKRFVMQSRYRRIPIDKELEQGLKTVRLKAGNETFEAFDINPQKSKQYIIFYHGLGQNITSNQHFYKSIIKKGYGVLAVEHSGFGNSTGQLSAISVKNNSKAVKNYLKEKGIDIKEVGVVSHSMGSFPATDFAKRNADLKFLILISPFNSLKNEKEFLTRNSAKLSKPLKFLIKKVPFLLNIFDKRFKIASKLKEIQAPVYLIHSADDRTIPALSSQELAKCSKNLKNFITLDTGKHGLSQEKIKVFENLV